MTAPALRMTTGDWAMLLICSVFWGSAYVFNKISIVEIPPLTFTAARLLIAAALLAAVALTSGVRLPPFGRAWKPFFVMTMLSNVVPFQFVLAGQREVSAGLAAVLGATTPLFLILLAHAFTTDEKITLGKLIGIMIGITGVAVVFGPDVLSGWSDALAAKAILVAAAVIYAVGAIYSKRVTGHSPLTIATLQMTAGAIIMTPVALVIDQPWTLGPISWPAIGGVVGTAILGSALAAITYFHVLRRAGATNAMLVTLLVPVTPILLGSVLLGEHLVPREVVGAMIIAAALVVIDGRLLRKARRVLP
jgi:drug/metabolite transporter (DMT)-like permease